MTYTVEIKQVYVKTVFVEAKSLNEAIDKVYEYDDNGKLQELDDPFGECIEYSVKGHRKKEDDYGEWLEDDCEECLED